jgi:DnaA-like protein
MTMIESPVRESPSELRKRLYNPPNSHRSEETEVVGNAASRQRQNAIAAARAAMVAQEARLVRDARGRRAAELLREYQFKLTSWVLNGNGVPPQPAVPKVLFEQIILTVSKFYSVPRIHIVSQRRTAAICRPRHVVMYLAREITELSFPMIGSRLSGRDHTTVIHGWNKITAELAAGDEKLADEIRQIKQMLEAE